MNYIKVFVVAALIISLFMNFRLLSRMESLENNVNNIHHYQSQIMNSVNNQSSNVHNIMEEFKREQSWISPIQMDVGTENLAKGKTTLSFEWQIKELLKNSEVVFHYKYGESEDFIAIQAVEKESGLFKVNVPVEIQLEPEWHVSVSTSGRAGNMAEETKREIEEKEMKERDKSQLSYYVTVSTEDLLKSSQMNTTNIGHLGMNYYGPLDIHIDIHEKGYYAAVMAPPTYYNNNNILLEEAYLLKYRNGKLVEEEKLVIMETNKDPNFEEMPIELHKKSTKEKFEYTSLGLKVVYSNGDVFEKEVYSE